MPRLVEIRMTKCALFLTESELVSLLVRDPELWQEAIRRGKGIMRMRKEAAREAKQLSNYKLYRAGVKL